MNSSSSHSLIFDAIHHVMEFPKPFNGVLKSVVDLPLFNRLRHIKQMAMGDLVFPTASHSRFSHCLGAQHLAIRIARAVGIQDPQVLMITALAALLHDIGHGPFSHAFEGFLHERLGYAVPHEGWTQLFMKDEALKKRLASEGLTEIDFSMINALINRKPVDIPLLNDIVSSQLDADRLDYLLRDSHFCGVAYGTYDLDWLISCLTQVETDGGIRLGITEKGIGAVENYLIARRLMYDNIYYNRKMLALEGLLIALLKGIQHHLTQAKPLISKYLYNFLTDLTPENFPNPTTLMEAKFSSYQYLCDYDIWGAVRAIATTDKKMGDLREIASRLYHRECPVTLKVKGISSDQLSLFKEKERIAEWKLHLMTVKVQPYHESDDPIYVKTSTGGVPLDHLSHLIGYANLPGEPQDYLIIDRELYQAHDWNLILPSL